MLTLRAIVYGLLLMLYFYICNLSGVADKIELRFFNFLILGIGLWTTLYAKAQRGKEFGVKYFSGLRDGLQFSVISSIVFAASFLLYLWANDFVLVDAFVAKGVINESITALHLAAVILVELITAGFILSFIFMQYLKYNHKKEDEIESEDE